MELAPSDEVVKLRHQISALQKRVMELEAESSQKDAMADYLKGQLDTAQDEIRQLNRLIGRLEGKLDKSE